MWRTESWWSNSEVYLSKEMKHPVLLARKSEIAVTIIRWCHEKVAHSGRGITINYIRSSGFWIIDCSAAVRSYISKCHMQASQKKLPAAKNGIAPE